MSANGNNSIIPAQTLDMHSKYNLRSSLFAESFLLFFQELIQKTSNGDRLMHANRGIKLFPTKLLELLELLELVEIRELYAE